MAKALRTDFSDSLHDTLHLMLEASGVPCVGLLAALLLAGCGGGASTPVVNPPVPPVTPPSTFTGVALSGLVTAAGKPLGSASIQLYAAGSSGNGMAPSALTPAVTADASGSFSIAGGYGCPASSSQLYLVARGGSLAGSGLSADNAAIALITSIGACKDVSAGTRFAVNEVTTAATAWALSQFLGTGGKLGATSSNSQGLANAVATAASLASIVTGAAPGPSFPANGSSVVPKLNAMANLLSACTSSAASCTSLFSLAGAGGSLPPTNTLDAALSIVRNPGANSASLFTLSQTSAVYKPSLASAPADWTLAVNLSGAGMNAPSGVAIDAQGSVWVANYFGVLSELSPTGSPVYAAGITGSGLGSSYGLAVDASGSVWVANESSAGSVNGGLGSVTVVNSAGQALSGSTGFTAGGINYPIAVAIDPNGTNWVLDYGNAHLTQLNSSGQPLSGSAGYTSALLSFPLALAIDANHNAWIANQAADKQGAYNVTRVSADGKQFTNFACCNAPSGIAIDAGGNVWLANLYGNSVSEVTADGRVLSNGTYTGGGLNYPQGIAIDGAGSVWVSNFRGNSLTQLAGSSAAVPGRAVSPAAGWGPDSALLQSFALAVDASGDVWISNFGNNTVTKFIGLAAPVKTPLLGPAQAP